MADSEGRETGGQGADEPAPVSDDQPTRQQEAAGDGGSEARGGQQWMPWESQGEREQQPSSESSSRVSVVDEQPPRPAPPDGASEDEYKWHSLPRLSVGPARRRRVHRHVQVVRPLARAAPG